MLGAIAGDIIGSVYERNNIKTKDFNLFEGKVRFTDDSVLTCAIANACVNYLEHKDKKIFESDVVHEMKTLGLNHLTAGYGHRFVDWLFNPIPYGSFGNGSAMRVSPIGWISESLEEALELAEISAKVSHNHPDGIKGAKAVVSAIFLARNGASKEEIKEYIVKNFYDISFTLDGIRDSYKFDSSCQGSVPPAIEAFLESSSFEDAIRNAISIGGDSDTLAAISGSIAEAFYGIPDIIKSKCFLYLDEELLKSVTSFYNVLDRMNRKLKR